MEDSEFAGISGSGCEAGGLSGSCGAASEEDDGTGSCLSDFDVDDTDNETEDTDMAEELSDDAFCRVLLLCGVVPSPIDT